MASTALGRFWRGMREPWDLLGRMRHDRPLWGRYWRTVLVQAALTLVAGLAVFWVGKQGAEAWNDAFGPEDLPESGASPVAGAALGQDPSAEEPPAARTTVGAPDGPRSPPPGKRAAPGKPGPVSPPPPAPPPPGGSRATPVPPSAPPDETRPATAPPAAEDEDDEESGDDDDTVEATIEQKVKALQEASPEERSKRTAELVAAALAQAKKEAGRAQKRAEKGQGKGKDDTADELTQDREDVRDKIEELTLAAETLAQATPSGAGEARKARRHLEKELDGVEREAHRLERRGAAALTEAERARLGRARASLQIVRRHERGLAGRLGAVLALLAAIYASLGIAQVGVLALSRDFHDALSRDLSLLVQLAPEDPPMRPKIRLDLPWVRRKANRRARFFLGFLPGTVLITLVGRLVPPHRILTTVLTALWAAYWWMVMTAGQSARAWSPPETTPRPWYLRAWFAMTDRVFLFRWGPFLWWGKIWERFSRRFYGPSERVEEQPFEFAGSVAEPGTAAGASGEAALASDLFRRRGTSPGGACGGRAAAGRGHRGRGGGRRDPRAGSRGAGALRRRDLTLAGARRSASPSRRSPMSAVAVRPAAPRSLRIPRACSAARARTASTSAGLSLAGTVFARSTSTRSPAESATGLQRALAR